VYQVPGARIALDLGGPSVEVERVRSWAVQVEAANLGASFVGAKSPEDEYKALRTLFQFFLYEAQPIWDLGDHHGPIPPTADAWRRIPNDLLFEIIGQWQDSLAAAEPVEAPAGLTVVPDVVDHLIPPGPANRQIKRQLAAAKRRKAA
jgi:hypothetical protein